MPENKDTFEHNGFEFDMNPRKKPLESRLNDRKNPQPNNIPPSNGETAAYNALSIPPVRATLDLITSDAVFKQYLSDRLDKHGNRIPIIITYRKILEDRINGAFPHRAIHEKAVAGILSENPELGKYGFSRYVTLAHEAKESNGRNIVSEKGAVGNMQYLAHMARREGIKVTPYHDGRQDPEISIPKAIQRLAAMTLKYKSLEAALAEYNAGETRLNEAIKKANSNNFWEYEKFLPTETRNHVRYVLAASEVLKSPEDYGIQIANTGLRQECGKIHPLKKGENPYKVARQRGIEPEIVSKCNPALRNENTLPINYPLKLPGSG
ncbi:transglycosylase SLT domain-containing protein [Candidatus Woesearchaeota archaeon]|nr:transglycosylase SLT domain-containing protein [Candidatus Woesearchaeota archaeon]